MTQESFEHWLEQLDINAVKLAALDELWQQLNRHFENNEAAELKALEMVEILASLNLDKDSLCAALVLPLIETDKLSLEAIEEGFSESVFNLIKGVRQMDAIRSLHQNRNAALGNNQIDNVRRMLLSMVEDIRAVVIKLAERVCHLRSIKNDDEETKVVVAKETATIYAPLANRLGIGQLKWELEDISFRYLHPDTYKKIAKLLDEKRLDREKYVTDFVASIQNKLRDNQIKGDVYGRPKHIFSIWKKMQKKSLDFNELFDVRAVRVIVDELPDCYSALGIIHTSWNHLHNEFDDYVATPKPNGYQSIHTVVLGPEGKAVEIQIRTKQMHDDAELGVAAHWRYKEGTAGGKGTNFDDKINWLRKILQWQDDVSESGEMLDELRSQVFEDRIYVFTPNGDVIDLPAGSTPLDFAYYIHSNVGHRCIGAKVASRIVPFTYQLQTGDQVEILTAKNPNPSRDWLNPNLNYIHSSRARSKVQHFFKLLDKDKNIAAGKEMLDAELSKHSLLKVEFKDVIERFNVTNVEDLQAAIGAGDISLQQVVNFIHRKYLKKEVAKDAIDPKLVLVSENNKTAVDKNGITVSGVGNLLTHLAKCCQPVPGDDVTGFITQGRGISVHRADCEQLRHALDAQPERQVDVQWGLGLSSSVVSIQITAGDRFGLLRDVTTIIANERVSVLGMESKSDEKRNTVTISFKVKVGDIEVLNRLLDKVKQIDDVINAYRVNH